MRERYLGVGDGVVALIFTDSRGVVVHGRMSTSITTVPLSTSPPLR
jgi:hypothetical protein